MADLKWNCKLCSKEYSWRFAVDFQLGDTKLIICHDCAIEIHLVTLKLAGIADKAE